MLVMFTFQHVGMCCSVVAEVSNDPVACFVTSHRQTTQHIGLCVLPPILGNYSVQFPVALLSVTFAAVVSCQVDVVFVLHVGWQVFSCSKKLC